MTTTKELEPPECELGYTVEQLQRILGDRYEEFLFWMRGQTLAACQGKRYNHSAKEYEETGCGPHGFAYYAWDLQRFLDNRPVID